MCKQSTSNNTVTLFCQSVLNELRFSPNFPCGNSHFYWNHMTAEAEICGREMINISVRNPASGQRVFYPVKREGSSLV